VNSEWILIFGMFGVGSTSGCGGPLALVDGFGDGEDVAATAGTHTAAMQVEANSSARRREKFIKSSFFSIS
jgi:hypothetical protein